MEDVHESHSLPLFASSEGKREPHPVASTIDALAKCSGQDSKRDVTSPP